MIRLMFLIACLLYILIGLSGIGVVFLIGSIAHQRDTTFFLVSGMGIFSGLWGIGVGAKKLYDAKNAA